MYPQFLFGIREYWCRILMDSALQVVCLSVGKFTMEISNHDDFYSREKKNVNFGRNMVIFRRFIRPYPVTGSDILFRIHKNDLFMVFLQKTACQNLSSFSINILFWANVYHDLPN